MLALVEGAFQQHVPEVAGLPVIGLSALTGAGAEALMPAVLSAYQLWTQRVPTARLNSWLAKVSPPPPPPQTRSCWLIIRARG